MSDIDLQTDEEALEIQSRSELLTKGAISTTKKIGDMILRAPTMESMSYLWELKNYFVFRDENGRVARNNAVIGVAEFIYVHHADIDEVAEVMTEPKLLRQKLRQYINGPLSEFKALTEAMPAIEAMLTEYAAAQAEVDSSAKGGESPRGKGSIRVGKRHTSR
jgi:hypothetical protein